MKRVHFYRLMITIIVLAAAATARLLVNNINGSTANPTVSEVAAKQASVARTYGQLPLRFEENQGQTDGRVRFLSRGSGRALFLTATESVVTLQRENHKPSVLRMTLIGANPASTMSGLDKLSGTTSYFLGRDPEKWRTDVPNFAKVHYDELYPGVDLLYYGNQNELEYDFIVAPQVDPGIITFAFEGADRMFIDGDGDLVLQMQEGSIRQKKPHVYQDIDGVRRTVPAEYALKGSHRVGFQISGYDADRQLVIDPILSYSTYLGGSDVDSAAAIAVDAQGNAYITGRTLSTNFPQPAVPSHLNSGNSGDYDAFVTKLNSTGTDVLYSTYIGGSASDNGTAIAVDSSGSAHVTGYTKSEDFPLWWDLTWFHDPYVSTPNYDIFVVKLNATGTGVGYSTLWGGSKDDFAYGIAVDVYSNTYLTGHTRSKNFPVTAGAFQTGTAFIGNSEVQTGFAFSDAYSAAFVIKLSMSGTVINPFAPEPIYSTVFVDDVLGGEAAAYDIALNSSGEAYITGYTASSIPIGGAVFQRFQASDFASNGSWGPKDAFVARFNAAGSALIFSTYLGGGGNDIGYGIAVDGSNSVYVTGTTQADNFPVTPGSVQPTPGWCGRPESGCLSDAAFVTKINATGSSLVYSTYLGGPYESVGQGVKVHNGNAFVVGRTVSPIPGTQTSPIQPALAGWAGDMFLAQLNSLGSAIVHSTYLGGSNNEGVLGSAHPLAMVAGNAYIAGVTSSADFPMVPLAQPYRSWLSGASDAFVVKIGPTVDVSISKSAPAVVTANYAADYVLTVTNSGPESASSVVVTDTLPQKVRYESAGTTRGSCSQANGTVSCHVGTLNSGAQATITIRARFVQAGTITNTATVVSDGIDLNPADNQATATTALVFSCAGNVTSSIVLTPGPIKQVSGNQWTQIVGLRNVGANPIPGPIALVLDNFNSTLSNQSGVTACTTPAGHPYIDVGVGSDNVFSPNEKVTVTLEFDGNILPAYTARLLSNSGSR